MTRHQTLSYVKSMIRIAGYIALYRFIPLASIVLVISEVIGIVEEIGEK